MYSYNVRWKNSEVFASMPKRPYPLLGMFGDENVYMGTGMINDLIMGRNNRDAMNTNSILLHAVLGYNTVIGTNADQGGNTQINYVRGFIGAGEQLAIPEMTIPQAIQYKKTNDPRLTWKLKPGIVAVMMGTIDAINSGDVNATIKNYDALISLITAEGIWPIICSPVPRMGNNEFYIQQWRDKLQEYALKNNFLFVDFYKLLVNLSTGRIQDQYIDHSSPWVNNVANNLGCQLMGRELMRVLTNVFSTRNFYSDTPVNMAQWSFWPDPWLSQVSVDPAINNTGSYPSTPGQYDLATLTPGNPSQVAVSTVWDSSKAHVAGYITESFSDGASLSENNANIWQLGLMTQPGFFDWYSYDFVTAFSAGDKVGFYIHFMWQPTTYSSGGNNYLSNGRFILALAAMDSLGQVIEYYGIETDDTHTVEPGSSPNMSVFGVMYKEFILPSGTASVRLLISMHDDNDGTGLISPSALLLSNLNVINYTNRGG